MIKKLQEKKLFNTWASSKDIDRSFVLNRNGTEIFWQLWCRKGPIDTPDLSIVIPTCDADRDGLLIDLLDQIEQQTYKNFELIIVCGDPFQGRSINAGVAIARGRYIITLDDDTALPDPETFKKLVRAIETHEAIGIAGGNNVIPEHASFCVRRIMYEIPRRSWTPVRRIVDSDLAEHPCMIMRTDDFKRVGGENELIPRGLDPYLREQFRRCGKRVVVVPDVIYHHLPPNTIPKLLRQFFRNGRQAAYTNRNFPQWVIETPSRHGSFQARISFKLRLIRFPLRIIRAMLSLKPFWMLSEIAYGYGYICEIIRGK